MYKFKFIVICTLMACALSTSTDNPSSSNFTDSVPQEKSLLEQHQVGSSILISAPSAEKREKREDITSASSSSDNKRTQAVSQPDYQENKPPTFVHPVPVDQIIKNWHASPEIHSAAHKNEMEKKVDDKDEGEEDNESISDDDNSEHIAEYHRYMPHKKTITSKTKIESIDDDDVQSGEKQ